MITLQNVTCAYEGKTVLQGLSFAFPERGCVGILGPSGAGKTTLLRLLMGQIKPAGGTLTGLEDSRISVVFQEDRLLSQLTPAQNVALVNDSLDPRGFLAAMALSDAAEAPLSSLSGGMRRRVSIARALQYGGDVLLLDEPFKGLDDALRARILPVIKSAFPLVIVTLHERREADFFGCDALLSL